jgi:hypothetical protein
VLSRLETILSKSEKGKGRTRKPYYANIFPFMEDGGRGRTGRGERGSKRRRKRKNPYNLKRTKNPPAWKEEEGGRGRRNLRHGSPTSKEE